MIIEFDNVDIENLVNHLYTGRYKKVKSSSKLISDLDKVMRYLYSANSIEVIRKIGSLHYEQLKGSPNSSIRVGYNTKYRLIFHEKENKITLKLIELSEHYGDH